jgi:3alpha(or 20beta)-hydroxysteroid dehydrogenase
MARFTGKVIVISGGARGMGEAQARRIVAEGGKVVIGDVLVDRGRKVAADLGEACVFQPLDVTDEGQWTDAVRAAERLGAVHGLVNNAGIYQPAPLLEETVANFDRHMQINMLGTFLGIRSIAPAIDKSGGGSIVNLSSAAAMRASMNTIAYTATKWAVRGMTKSAALELVGKKIRVNSVHPGAIDTEMLGVRSPEENRTRSDRTPMKRFGTADEVAGLVLFLLSDESKYMTGSEVAMDGGFSL